MQLIQLKSLKTSFLVLFTPILALVIYISWLISSVTADILIQRFNQHSLDVAGQRVEKFLDEQQLNWVETGEKIAAEGQLLTAYRAGDQAAFQQILETERAQAEADFIELLKADVVDPSGLAGFVREGEQLRLQVATPLSLAGADIWLKVGRNIDQQFTEDLKVVSKVDMTLLTRNERQTALVGTTRNITSAAADKNSAQTGSDTNTFTLETVALLSLSADERHDYSAQHYSTDYPTDVMPLGKTGLGLFAVLQTTTTDASTLIRGQTLRNIGLLLAASLGLMLLGGWLFSRFMITPLKRLSSFAKEVQHGNYAKTIDIDRKDEIGQLAYALNVMNQSIALREEEMLHMAYYDTLTGLPNRAMFNDRLTKAVNASESEPTPFCIMMIDLDRFKFINDVLGHEAGDYALKVVSKRLQSVLRKSDTVARLGGDEFGILLPTAERARIEATAKHVIAALEQPVAMRDQHVDMGGSIGVAVYPTHGTEASVLLRHADVAMYEAKRSGIGYAFFDNDSEAHQQVHLSLLGDIRKAASNNEFELYYQPKVAISRNEKPNMEVLIRWNHPERGFIPPDEFIPFAEQTGSIRLVTMWVIDKAISDAGAWYNNNLPVKISVNVSSRDLLNPNLADIVEAAMTKAKLPPEYLCLEITEGALMEDPDKAREMVQRLFDMGIRISIDDYGTGYSSLAYVANLPVSELKIDRTFVSNMLVSEEDAAIVRSTIELGHYLKMEVVAEGIEHYEELEKLHMYGCDYVQGYMVSKPMTAKDMLKWLIAADWKKFHASLQKPKASQTPRAVKKLPKAANE